MLNCENPIDRTVRAKGSLRSPLWRGAGGTITYIGPDHCTLQGAMALAKRLKEYWAARGKDKLYEIYPARSCNAFPGDAVYGIRAMCPVKLTLAVRSRKLRADRPQPPPIIGETPRQRVKRIVRQTLMTAFPEITYESVMRPWACVARDKTPMELQARRACIMAVHDDLPQIGFLRLGAIFNCDHTTVLYAVSSKVREAKARNQRIRDRAERAKLQAERLAA